MQDSSLSPVDPVEGKVQDWRVIVYDEAGRVIRNQPLVKRTKKEADLRGKALFDSISAAASYVVQPC